MDLDIDLTEDGVFVEADAYEETKTRVVVDGIRLPRIITKSIFGKKDNPYDFLEDKFVDKHDKFSDEEYTDGNPIPTGNYETRTVRDRIAERVGIARFDNTCPCCGNYNVFSSYYTDVCDRCEFHGEINDAIRSIS